MSDLAADFGQAQEDVKTLTKRPSNEDLAFLYGHFKQAKEGDVKGSRPGMLNMVARAKYDSWGALKGMTNEAAMQAYVDKVTALLQTHR